MEQLQLDFDLFASAAPAPAWRPPTGRQGLTFHRLGSVFLSPLFLSLSNIAGAGEARFSGSATPAPPGTYRPVGGRQGRGPQQPCQRGPQLHWLRLSHATVCTFQELELTEAFIKHLCRTCVSAILLASGNAYASGFPAPILVNLVVI